MRVNEDAGAAATDEERDGLIRSAALSSKSTGGAPSNAPKYEEVKTPNEGVVNTAAASTQGAPTTTSTPPASMEEQQAREETAEDLMHGINSFWAVVAPVCVTMVIASIAVVNCRSRALERSMGSYLVYNEVKGAEAGEVVGHSLVNALVVIGFVTGLTFFMALLYKFNCMRILVGYIMFSSSAILGFVGGQLVDTVNDTYLQWPIDWVSFLFIMVNFSFVGVVAIFYQKGIPKSAQNTYLVFVSVILAWQFSMWPEWTTWIFCIMFACYDLCAVLTPCGPLKVLINLIQEKQAPMPGLLYEAEVRDGVGNPAAVAAVQTPAAPAAPRPTTTTTSSSSSASRLPPREPRTAASSALVPPSLQGHDLTDPFPVHECDTEDDFKALLFAFYARYSPDDTWKVDQVAARFFPNQSRMWPSLFHKYMVCSCGTESVPCSVQSAIDVRNEQRRERAAEDDEDKTIKLGLGDFIFYSVLVGRAAIYDFSTCVICFLCILMGLGGTLFLLSVLHKALPALPISIFMATAFYFWARYTLTDFFNFVTVLPSAL
ncbi:hypothetical protein, variant 1 [Aphanomyces astaci]|uniref:Presenilin n=1 Tax=Aphanomyces astaci TaxID=112090 RepID=W4GUX1_APHAT|nr:hypothetical protein, variant 1 [Aphanomyces astaci]ETV82708.1 hypothetical protein, variant 1 [Aphanomyces astaci]|eukprot:XP_009827379.1 hypothetical protein, variant 1 [Aphanomyces astaci]